MPGREARDAHEGMRIEAEAIDDLMADKKVFFLDVREPEKSGFKIAGFCGLKGYQGGKLEPARRAPAPGSSPRSRSAT